jgi:hypothetical protein
MSTIEQPPGPEAIDAVWTKLTEEDNRQLYHDLRATTMRQIDERCKQQINAGNYDSTANLADVFEWFAEKHLDSDSELVREVFESTTVQRYTRQYGPDVLGRIVFDRLIQELEQDDELIYVYDQQRVRSQVAEMVRYFALLRQRIDEDTDFDFAPSLVKMAKLAIVDREQPMMEGESAVSFGKTLRTINRELSSGAEPASELAATLGDDWRGIVKETVAAFKKFLDDGLPEEFDSLAAYQKRALVEVYLQAVTEGEPDEELAHVITASTGGGKTEAFLFPVLMYCHTAWKAGIAGTKAILTYPRRDLCDNQFERLFDYVYTLNDQLATPSIGFDEAPVSIALQHGGRDDIELDCPECDGTLSPPDDDYEGGPLSCSHDESHRYEWATTDRSESADIVVMTQNSLHLRLMDWRGREAFWDDQHPPKFLVLDEVHVYTEQSGMHVSNVVRRFKRAARERAPAQTPSLVASSATINEAEDFTSRIFGVDEAQEITPATEETDTIGSEYIVFVKATEPRDVAIPIGDSVFKPQDEWEDIERTTASNLSSMIQIAFAFWHTARKERGGTNRPDKDKILGFVDSIDSVSRLGGYVEDAEQERELFKLRRPDAVLRGEGQNPDCPRARFREGSDDQFNEAAVCDSVVPNANRNECSVYEAGECWWTMRENFELRPMQLAVQKSGRRQRPTSPKDPGDEWDQLIATSTLEVGFDHESIIGTFQYRAPMSVPSFLQRKGRGGRDAEDRPVTVVVLGSNSTDSYYFHHSDYLSDPREEHLEIPLDEHNRFVRAEHMVAAVFDYFNVHDGIDAARIYQGQKGREGPDVAELDVELSARRGALEDWLEQTFEVDDGETEQALDTLASYVESLQEPVAPEIDDTPYWELFSEAVEGAGTTGSYRPLDELLAELRGEHNE